MSSQYPKCNTTINEFELNDHYNYVGGIFYRIIGILVTGFLTFVLFVWYSIGKNSTIGGILAVCGFLLIYNIYYLWYNFSMSSVENLKKDTKKHPCIGKNNNVVTY